MIVKTEEEMMAVGEKLAGRLASPVVLELVGDVGVGKTTLVKGLARGLRVEEMVNSPSFTILRVYEGRDGVILRHYDFYRLADAGILAEELAEVVGDARTVTVVEWGESVAEVLQGKRVRAELRYLDDGSREVEILGLDDMGAER